MIGEQYNEDYYEHGREKRISWYNGYNWIPTRSIPEALAIIEHLPKFHTVLDYGAAKGFLVHALRLMGKESYGVDISQYAIDNCHPKAKNYISSIDEEHSYYDCISDLIIAKNVLEPHTEQELNIALEHFYTHCDYLLIVIPLADNNLYRIPVYEDDITHIIREDEEWWLNKIRSAGFTIERFSYSMGALKEHWVKEYPYGNGFFICKSNS